MTCYRTLRRGQKILNKVKWLQPEQDTRWMPQGISSLCSNHRLYSENYQQKPNKEIPTLSFSNHQSAKVPPKDPPLLILHGLFGSKTNWESIGKYIASTGRRVVTIDARNHGESDHVSSMDYLLMAQDVERLMYKLGIFRANILGHSMGGKTAMCLAIKRPRLVEKLIVVDVAPDTTRTALVTAFPEYLAEMRKINFDESINTLSEARKEANDQLQHIFSDKGVRAFITTNIKQTASGFDWRINIDSIEWNLDLIVGFPTLEGCYTGETLFIGGSESQHIRAVDEPTIKQLFPSARLEFIEGAGHWVHSDKPQQFIQCVQQFLDS